jgi:peptide chain release factor 1
MYNNVRGEYKVNQMLERLQAVMERYEQLRELLFDPAVASDPKRLSDYSKVQSGIQELYQA